MTPLLDGLGLDSQTLPWGVPRNRVSFTLRGIIEPLHRVLASVMHLPDGQASLVETGSKMIGNTPEEFAGVIRSEHARYGKLIAESGIKLE